MVDGLLSDETREPTLRMSTDCRWRRRRRQKQERERPVHLPLPLTCRCWRSQNSADRQSAHEMLASRFLNECEERREEKRTNHRRRRRRHCISFARRFAFIMCVFARCLNKLPLASNQSELLTTLSNDRTSLLTPFLLSLSCSSSSQSQSQSNLTTTLTEQVILAT